MKGYLLDTHAFIWWLNNSPELSKTARKTISSPENTIFFSHVSYWEMAIKVSIGRLEFPMEAINLELQKNSFELLTISSPHILQSTKFPMIHRDPFDRLLMAQAKVEKLTLLSVDKFIHQYDVVCVW